MTVLKHSKIGLVCSLATAMFCSSGYAAAINYGDFTGATVNYLDVEESSTEILPLFSAPNTPVIGDTLVFNPTGNFKAEAEGSGSISDSVTGRLEFFLETQSGGNLTSLKIKEAGDYGWSVLAGASAGVGVTVNVQILDMDQLTILFSDNISFSDSIASAAAFEVFNDSWALDLTVDLSSLNRNKVFVIINNNLSALASGPAATSFVEKKFFNLSVPEPGSVMLLGAGVLSVFARRRRI